MRKFRNSVVFESKQVKGKLECIKAMLTDFRCVNESLLVMSSYHTKLEAWIGWTPPEEGWIKINTDGTLSFALDFATAGGVIRNEKGIWLVGFCS